MDKTVTFIENHVPALEAGEYTMTVSQTLTGAGIGGSIDPVEKTFYVAGERFALTPDLIDSVFPPAGGIGEWDLVLPHIMLNRSTLPWEREPATNQHTPWMALLMIYESEKNKVTESTVSLSHLKEKSITSPYFPGLVLEPGQVDTQKVAVLDVDYDLFVNIHPRLNDLQYLSHVRIAHDKKERAVVIANRLPSKEQAHTVYLVSLEGRYDTNGFDYQNAQPGQKIRLLQLYSWSYRFAVHRKVTRHGIDHCKQKARPLLNKLETLLGQSYLTKEAFKAALSPEITQNPPTNEEAFFKAFEFGDFAQVLSHLDRSSLQLCLPSIAHQNLTEDEKKLNHFLQLGYVPLPHHMRAGGKTLSWYHGPLGPPGAQNGNLPEWKFAPCSDALLRYFKDGAMWDVSYAAAWEMGRLLALQNVHFSTELYNWKMQFAKSRHAGPQSSLAHLRPGSHGIQNPPPMPDSVKSWLGDLVQLKGIPYNYLIPDVKLLPAESIRFFTLDMFWLRALVDGAMSIGRSTRLDHELDQKILDQEKLLLNHQLSGFVLRSEAVAGWPGMYVEGNDTLTPQHRVNLAEDLMLCLFEGELETLSLHLKPDVLHFGFERKNGKIFKKMRRITRGNSNDDVGPEVAINPLSEYKRINMQDISQEMSKLDARYWVPNRPAASLAVQLIQGMELIRFHLKKEKE